MDLLISEILEKVSKAKTKKEKVVNELKKSTLGIYIKKATGDAISKSHVSHFNLQKGEQARDKGKKKLAKITMQKRILLKPSQMILK